MGFEADEEILQDFLVEAGEILEQLSEQLIELERSPDDRDLLNAIFRGFHTVKGGAGFLQLTPLVDCCHAAENVFDTLRNGLRQVDADLMDAVLRGLDNVNEMFAQVSNGETPQPADEELVALLHRYAEPASADEGPAETEAAPVAEAVEVGAAEDAPKPGDDITDAVFEELLDAISPTDQAGSTSASDSAPSTPPPAASELSGGGGDEITDDEFEALLDELHGKGQFKAGDDAAPAKEDKPAAPAASSNSDEITDDEFEA